MKDFYFKFFTVKNAIVMNFTWEKLFIYFLANFFV